MNSISSFYSSMCSMTPSNKEMLAREVQPLKNSNEELCQFLKDLDSVELSLQNTDKELAIMKSINEQREISIASPSVAFGVSQFMVTGISLVNKVAAKIISTPSISGNIFKWGTLGAICLTGVLGAAASRYATGLEKGYGLARVRINRLYEKVNNIQKELILLKERKDLQEVELKQIESTIKQLEIVQNNFKELADYYSKVEKNASNYVDGVYFNERGPFSRQITNIENVPFREDMFLVKTRTLYYQ